MSRDNFQNWLGSGFLLALLLWQAPGCTTVSSNSPNGIDEIHLFGLAEPLGGPRGVGGIGVRVYASSSGLARGVPILHGRLELVAFDRPDSAFDPRTEPPLKIWGFDAAELAEFRARTIIGEGYQLELHWDKDQPKSKAVTVVARYRVGDGQAIYSAPATITTATRPAR